jgi:REP element-mobilizing transposase RayT
MEAAKTYHIYTHPNGSENPFRSDENFRYFLKRYAAFIPSVADSLAWCLMPNHLHLLVRIKREEEIVKVFATQTSEVLLPRNINLGGLGVNKDLGGINQKNGAI